MIISDIQSTEYAKHYGNMKTSSFYSGEGLSASAVLNGGVRGLYDSIEIDTLPSGQVALGWRFNEDVTIMDGTLIVSEALDPASGIAVVDIYDSDRDDANYVARLFEMNTDMVGTHIGTFNWGAAIPYIPKGSVLCFHQLYGTPISGVKINYSLIFMSAL